MAKNDAYLTSESKTPMDKVKNLNFKTIKVSDPIYKQGASTGGTINPSNLEAKYSSSGSAKISYRGGSASDSTVNPSVLALDFDRKADKKEYGAKYDAMARAGKA